MRLKNNALRNMRIVNDQRTKKYTKKTLPMLEQKNKKKTKINQTTKITMFQTVGIQVNSH